MTLTPFVRLHSSYFSLFLWSMCPRLLPQRFSLTLPNEASDTFDIIILFDSLIFWLSVIVPRVSTMDRSTAIFWYFICGNCSLIQKLKENSCYFLSRRYLEYIFEANFWSEWWTGQSRTSSRYTNFRVQHTARTKIMVVCIKWNNQLTKEYSSIRNN